jgi:preprotein translocase subunit YajC
MFDLFISSAYAQTAAPAAQADWTSMLIGYLPLLFVFAIFYLLIIKPQNEASKAHALLIKNVKRNDVVLIDGGLIGEVSSVKEEMIHLRINHEDEVCVARASIKKVLSAEEAKGWEPTKTKLKK